MTEEGLQIAIDGPAASGKSTLGRSIAASLSYQFLDTGQMYRAVTLKALLNRVSADDEVGMGEIARALDFALSPNGLLIDGVPAGPELHSPEVDSSVSEISAHPTVRSALVRRQREMASVGPIVMVGRDIGTTVLPDAPIKIWLTASGAERARRRLQDQPERLVSEGHEAAVARLGSRDRYDASRTHSPLQKAPDAIVIDTDGQSPGQVLEQALEAIRAAFERSPS